MLIIKNVLFWILFSIISLFFLIIMLPTAFLPAKKRHKLGVAWSKCVLWLLKVCIGLKYSVSGIENIPDKPSIVCCKHQSGFETIALNVIFPLQVFVLKQELFYIPVFGQGLMLMSPIAINRKKRSNAIKQMLEQGRKRLSEGFWISIFPEGTRMPPGVRGKYKQGAARMAQTLHMDIVPVSVNSGIFWPKNSFMKYPGTVSFVISPKIAWDYGTADEIMQKCETVIETQQALIEENYLNDI